MGKDQPKKVAKHKIAPNFVKPAKLPHSRDMPSSSISWRFSRADKGGPFAWSDLAEPAVYKAVMERLHCFETMCDREIGESGSHAIPLSSLSKDAQRRLEEIQQDDVDALMSFRINGPARVFCIREREVMRVLWYDPDHLVCPSAKRHT